MMKTLRMTFVALATAIGAAAHPAIAGDTLDGEALLSRVAGNTIHYHAGSEDIFEYLASDGSIHGESTVHGKYAARWRLYEGDSICFEHADPMASGCVRVKLQGSQIEYLRRDDVVEGPFELL